MPKISIIVPVYKVEAYLHRCVDSILAQTFTDFELILVDDGSPDSCGQICDEYAEKDKRIRMIHKKNGGVSSARNAGLDIAMGEYISFVDSDDCIDPCMYERLLITAKQEKADIVECGYQWGVYSNKDSGKVFSYTNISAIEKAFSDTRFESGLSINVVGKLFKRFVFEHIRFLEDSSYGEDMNVAVRAFYKSKKVVKLDITMYMYVQNDGSCMNSGYALYKALGEIRANESLIRFFDENNEIEFKRYFVSRTLNIMYSHLYKCYDNGVTEIDEATSIIRKEMKQIYLNVKYSLSAKEHLKYYSCQYFGALWYLAERRRQMKKNMKVS